MAPRPHTVAVVITHGVSPFELSVACEVFGLDRSELVAPWYRLMVCSLVDVPVRTKSGGGMTVNEPYRLADLEQADTIDRTSTRRTSSHHCTTRTPPSD